MNDIFRDGSERVTISLPKNEQRTGTRVINAFCRIDGYSVEYSFILQKKIYLMIGKKKYLPNSLSIEYPKSFYRKPTVILQNFSKVFGYVLQNSR